MASGAEHKVRGGLIEAPIDPPSAANDVVWPEDVINTGVSSGFLAGAALGIAGGLLAGSEGWAARAVAGAVLGGVAGAGLGYVAAVQKRFDFDLETFARAINVSPRTASDLIKQRKAPDPKHLRPVHELNRLYEALVGIVDPEEIGPWMEQPNPAFDGFAPLDLIVRGQTDRLWRMIYQMESGSTS